MKRTTQDVKHPYRTGDYRLLRSGRRGTCWQSPDGSSVRLAAPEHELPVERMRMSMVAMLVALIATGASRK